MQNDFNIIIKDLINIAEKQLYEGESNGKQTIVESPNNIKLSDDDIRQLILNGFLPYIHEQLFIEYWIINNMDLNEIKFWMIELSPNDDDGNVILHSLKNLRKWTYCSIEGWKEVALKTGDSLSLLLYYPSGVYLSKRPKTDMLSFRQVTSTEYTPEYLSTIGKNYLPVTRYSSGMSNGLYYESNEGFCGTFYYLESESKVYLTFGSYRAYRNKYEAMIALQGELEGSSFDKEHFAHHTLYDLNYRAEHTPDYYVTPEKYPEDLKMTPMELYTLLKEDYDYTLNLFRSSEYENHDRIYDLTDVEEDISNGEFIKSLPNIKRYAGKQLGLYALEDAFDQPICNLCNKLNIDVVIFTHMIGSHQIVSEVMDSRDRMVSISSLIYPAS
jgi:hypothetical protein